MTITITEPVPIHFKLCVMPRLREAGRTEELRDLARDIDIPAGEDNDNWTPDYRTECTLRTLIHYTLLRGDASAAWKAFREYRDSLLTADGVESGEIPWRDYSPRTAYGYGDRKEQAWWDAVGEVDGWMNVLLHGHPEARARYIHTTVKAGA